MAIWPSASKASTTNLDSGTDSPAAARADIKTNVDNVNSIIDMFNITSPTNNQILQYSSANARFEVATPSSGAPQVAMYQINSIAVSVGANPSALDITSAWTEIYDNIGASTSSGQFTLPAGTYLIKWFFNEINPNGNATSTFFLTDSSNNELLSASASQTTAGFIKHCVLTDYRTFASSTTLKIRGSWSGNTFGFMSKLVLEFTKIA